MAITVAERLEIEKLIVLMFNAAPGAIYLSEATAVYESLGHNLNALATTLDDIPLFNTLHPNFQTAAEFAADFLTPLGLQNDELALSFVIGKFNAGISKGQIMYDGLWELNHIGEGASAQYVNAKAIVDNKAEVSEYYSATVGVQQTDFAVLQLVLNGVTADDATVTTAINEINDGTRGTNGIEATLTPSQDTITGTNSSDTVSGLFGDPVNANNTYTAGDSIDLGQGHDRLNLVALNTTASQAIIVKNVEEININDTVGATFNALLVENAPGISFMNTVTGQTSTVTNAATASVYGLAGKGNLTVDFASTSGKADTANVSINGVGTSTSARSTINVSDGSTIEKVSIAATGANFVTLTGGTVAASLVITGDGTNNFKLDAADSLAAVATIDASASTGANTFALGGNLNTGTNIKGGSGADTVSTTLASATLVGPTMSGVETLNTTFTGAAVVDLAAATGLTSVGVSASTAAMKFQNAQASVANLSVTTLTTVDSALSFGYGSATKGALALKVGSTAGAVDLGAVSISNSTALSVTTVGAFAHDFDSLKVTGNQSALSFTVGADAGLTTGDVTATGNLGALNVTVGDGGYFSGSVIQAAGKTIGDVTLNVTGTDSELDLKMSGGVSIGNVALNVTGDDISGYVWGGLSGGGVGNISVTVTGDSNDIGVMFSAGYVSGDGDIDGGGGYEVGNIGNVTISVTGDDNTLSGGAKPEHGNLGDVSITVNGDGNWVGFSGMATHGYYYHNQTTGQDSGYYYVDGGNIGTVSVSIDGDSSGDLYFYSSGGTIGDVTISLDNDANLTLNVVNDGEASWIRDLPMTTGDIGNVSITMGDDTYFSGAFSAAGGDIGNVSLNVTGNDADLNVVVTAVQASGGYGWGTGDSDDYFKGGNVGDVTLTVDGNDATYAVDVTASGGDIGAVSIAVNGDGASGWVDLNAQTVGSGGTGGNVGGVNASLANGTSLWLGFDVDGALGGVTVVAGNGVDFVLSGGGGEGGSTAGSPASTGAISLTFGDDATTYLYISGYSGSVGAITGSFGDDASGSIYVQDIDGSIGAMNLTFGAGAGEYIHTGAATGSVGVMNLTAGAGSILYVGHSGGASSMGKVTLTGGDSSSSAGVYVSDTGSMIATHGGVDASAWLGTTGIDLEAVTLGTTIRVGAAGSWTRGTEGADNIFLGAGKDTVAFDATPTASDVLFSFTVGAGKDVLDLNATAPADATFMHAVETVDAAYTPTDGTVVRLVDIAGGQDITTAAGLAAALSTTGEYTLHDFNAGQVTTVITAASATASTFYVFQVTDADGGTDTAVGEIVLMGVVNATAASAIGGLVFGNFA